MCEVYCPSAKKPPALAAPAMAARMVASPRSVPAERRCPTRARPATGRRRISLRGKAIMQRGPFGRQVWKCGFWWYLAQGGGGQARGRDRLTWRAPVACVATDPAGRANRGKGAGMEHLDQTLKTLFVDLHRSGLWPDEKEISDSILLAPAAEILRAYEAEQAKGDVDLRGFYARFFRPVAVQEGGYRTDPAHSPAQHLAAIWPHLTRAADDPAEASSRFPLPRPYVVVGGRFQEAYYWDSYFTQLGLLKTGQFGLVRNMLDNFAHAIASIGHIPNGFRSYFLTRSQPPFFAAMVQDYGRATGDLAAAYADYLPAMEAEYRYFMDTPHTTGGPPRP